jgi:hypothetical protein
VKTAKRELAAKSQESKFVDEFLQLPAGFDGYVAVLSDRNLAAVALEQVGLELASTATSVPLKVPFLVGSLADFLARDVHRSTEFTVTEGELQVTKGSETETGSVSVDGHFLIGPLQDGDWLVRVDAEGYLPLEQTVGFPALPEDIELTNLTLVNPVWLSSTLSVNQVFQGTVIRPREPMTFFFDTSAPSTLSENVRQAFRQWVTVELPQFGSIVEDDFGDRVPIGGAGRYQETDDPPSAGNAKVVLSPNLQLGTKANATVFVQNVGTTLSSAVRAVTTPGDNSEPTKLPEASAVWTITGALLEYNPDLLDGLGSTAEKVAEVAKTFWASVFLRTEAVADLGSFAVNGLPGESEKLTPIQTIMTRGPQSFVTTPYDNLYWEILRHRPLGTVITGDLETLPKR